MIEFAKQIMRRMIRVTLQQRLLAIDVFYTRAGLSDTEHLDAKNKLKLKAHMDFVEALAAVNSSPTVNDEDANK